jgi:hypothetical protein
MKPRPLTLTFVSSPPPLPLSFVCALSLFHSLSRSLSALLSLTHSLCLSHSLSRAERRRHPRRQPKSSSTLPNTKTLISHQKSSKVSRVSFRACAPCLRVCMLARVFTTSSDGFAPNGIKTTQRIRVSLLRPRSRRSFTLNLAPQSPCVSAVSKISKRIREQIRHRNLRRPSLQATVPGGK